MNPQPTDTLTTRQALIILNAHTSLGPVSRKRLLEAYNHDPRRILSASPEELSRVQGIGRQTAHAIAHWQDSFDLAREERRLDEHNVHFICRGDPDYPPLLNQIYDPPAGLYVKGPLRPSDKAVAIIGTRYASLYGQQVAKRLATDLVQHGFCVVSGMARGIDTAAHQGALDAQGHTVAVLGCGVDIVYPPENLDIYRAISEQGAIISELPFGTPTTRNTFPMRNRLISGLCQAIIVVESGPSGGSMITARFAGEHGRLLFAVPGRIDQEASLGCHQLIRDGAILLRSIDDLLDELNYGRPTQIALNLDSPHQPQSNDGDKNLSSEERAILKILREGDTLMIDQIANLTGLPIATLNATLLMLELKKRVAKKSDGRFSIRTP